MQYRAAKIEDTNDAAYKPTLATRPPGKNADTSQIRVGVHVDVNALFICLSIGLWTLMRILVVYDNHYFTQALPLLATAQMLRIWQPSAAHVHGRKQPTGR